MVKKKKTELGEKSQHEKFVEAARELECDDDEAAFRAKLKKLTEAPPPETVEKKKKKKVTKA
ncbi:MAG: hypothetical protein HY765_00450, partial [Rhodomicrobium sp.]|nr:hypothetical protein [Rhodomicrobium sp.]